MIDDLKHGLQLAKGVVDLAKGLKDLSDKSNNLEIREAAAELRSKTIDLKETVNDMRNEIIKLEKQLEFKEKLSFNGKIFEYNDGNKKVYVCNGCKSKGKYVYMTEDRGNNGYHSVRCPVCKNKVTLEAGAISVERKYSGARQRGSWQGN